MIDPIYLAVSLLTFLGGFFFMEFVAFLMHKYLQHGRLWFLHQDHHRHTKSRFQKNDLFTIFYSIVTMLLLVFGFFGGFDYRFWIGLGIFFYGMGFFVYHDMVFHRRIKTRYRPKNNYLLRIINAHRTHHQKSTATEGVNFGFFIVGKQYEPT